ncbi:hypothetical protein ENHYD8BJ_80326 [Enhydrobacter sp. 8BJ]|nr:hypothetical protein ENHYD8BJ_80326 [Enhydrobacter sp. 8BJ]
MQLFMPFSIQSLLQLLLPRQLLQHNDAIADNCYPLIINGIDPLIIKKFSISS